MLHLPPANECSGGGAEPALHELLADVRRQVAAERSRQKKKVQDARSQSAGPPDPHPNRKDMFSCLQFVLAPGSSPNNIWCVDQTTWREIRIAQALISHHKL